VLERRGSGRALIEFEDGRELVASVALRHPRARHGHPSVEVAESADGGHATVLDEDDGLIPASFSPVVQPAPAL